MNTVNTANTANTLESLESLEYVLTVPYGLTNDESIIRASWSMVHCPYRRILSLESSNRRTIEIKGRISGNGTKNLFTSRFSTSTVIGINGINGINGMKRVVGGGGI